MKFLVCEHCGNIVAVVEDKKVPVMCCGQRMSVLVPNTKEAATEKHLPVVTVDGGKVEVVVGSTIHPMSEEHSIRWICLETESGNQRKCLSYTGEPKATFYIAEGEKVLAAYEYCNLHGLWKTEL